MSFAISDPSIVVNNIPISIVPGSVKFNEGKGEQKMRAASTGGGNVEQVYSDDVSTHFSMVKFSLHNDIESIESAKTWKTNKNNNVILLSGKNPSGKSITRTFGNAALLSNYEVELGSDSSFDVEFTSNAAG